MADGVLLPGFPAPLDDLVSKSGESVFALPAPLRELEQAKAFPVEFTDFLQDLQAETLKKVSV